MSDAGINNSYNLETDIEKAKTNPELSESKEDDKFIKYPLNDQNSSTISETLSNSDIVKFKVIYNKSKYDMEFPIDETIGELKKYLEKIIGIPPSMQKIMVKGLAKDDQTLRDCCITSNSKLMVVGSTLTDVLSVSTVTTKPVYADVGKSKEKDVLCKQNMHQKILEKGIPEDAMPGIRNCKDSLPTFPIYGMVNKQGSKVRLTFKLESDQLWIGTKERTEKIHMNSIKNVVSEPIENHEEYHIMGLQLGPTEASRYWIYWVPAQYIDAIKDIILGKWQHF